MCKKLADGILLMFVLAALLGGGNLMQQGRAESWQVSANTSVAAQPANGTNQTPNSTANWSINMAGSTIGNSSPQTARKCKWHRVGKPLL